MSRGKRARDGLDRSRALPGEDRGVPVPVKRWRSVLPDDAWPAGFPKSGHVWRQDVFDVADRWREGRATVRQLLAATLMWTDGDRSAGRRRAVRALDADPDGALLDVALAPLRADRPTTADLRDAYLALRTTARLPGVDSDTCTRLLYFAGYRRGRGGTQPLILDAIIAGHLPRDAEISGPARRGSSLEWVRYLAWAALRAGEHEEPDRVEMDLAAGGARYGAAAIGGGDAAGSGDTPSGGDAGGSGDAGSGGDAVRSGEARGRHARR